MEGLPNSSSSAFSSNQPHFVLHQDSRRNPQTGAAISKIEEILVANIDALKEARVLTIPLRSRRTDRVQLVRFPSSRDTEANKFTALLQILHLSHEALVAGTIITKRFALPCCTPRVSTKIFSTLNECNNRGIYYQNPELFRSQQYVDELVDDIAFTFGLGRDALNIVAASKGLIAGAISVTVNNGSILNCNPDGSQGILLPNIHAISSVNVGAVKWLLVIEKEATFRGLVASRYHENSTVGSGILVTAKGYPDLSTRQFLHQLHTSFPTLPMYGLVDFDPDGVKIMLTYKNGSQSLQHEENATLNRLFWIGPRSNDILGGQLRVLPSANMGENYPANHTSSGQFLSSQSSRSLCRASEFSPVDVTLPLKATDRRLAVRLLSAAIGRDDQFIESLDYVRELQVMLLLNTKAEIQAVDEAGDLTTWLDNTLTKNMNRI
ncbi:Spo11/DNA topoisomerase VI subunit A [Xylaria digitata]|nr:Spo11/DNA topoisomerase VI subunit A [Xylaria digitata]